MKRRIRKILITNAIALNGGDAAILHATIAILRRCFGEDIEVTVHDMAARASARYYPGLSFRRDIYSDIAEWSRGRARPSLAGLVVLAAIMVRNVPFLGNALQAFLPPPLHRTLRDYKEADLVVSSGGTYLVPHYSFTSKLFDFMVAEALGKPLVLFTQSLGPFPPSRRRFLLRAILRRAHLIFVRDERSYTHLEELGLSPERIVLCADAAFALAPESLQGRTFSPQRPAPRIAISVRDWPHFKSGSGEDGMERYFRAMAVLVSDLVLRRDAQVTFISTCQGTPEYWTDDSRTAEEILHRLPNALHGNVTIDRQFRRPAEFIAELATFDLTVATRLHAAIMSLCAGTPVLPIAYEFKTTELFRRFGLGDAVIDIEDISPETVLGAFEKGTAFWSVHAEEAWATAKEERAAAFRAGDYLAQSFLSAQLAE
jgi:colanic acid/amylovoran biosynthesis protein